MKISIEDFNKLVKVPLTEDFVYNEKSNKSFKWCESKYQAQTQFGVEHSFIFYSNELKKYFKGRYIQTYDRISPYLMDDIDLVEMELKTVTRTVFEIKKD